SQQQQRDNECAKGPRNGTKGNGLLTDHGVKQLAHDATPFERSTRESLQCSVEQSEFVEKAEGAGHQDTSPGFDEPVEEYLRGAELEEDISSRRFDGRRTRCFDRDARSSSEDEVAHL